MFASNKFANELAQLYASRDQYCLCYTGDEDMLAEVAYSLLGPSKSNPKMKCKRSIFETGSLPHCNSKVIFVLHYDFKEEDFQPADI